MPRLVRKPFKGAFFYEWQVGPLVFLWRHVSPEVVVERKFTVFHDRYWRM